MNSKKTGMRCSVQFCPSKAYTRNVSLFQYPKDERLAIWLKNCRTENLSKAISNSNNYKVCGAHFENSMFLNSTTKNRLVFNAIPTLFSDEILFERSKLAGLQSQTCDDNLNNQSGCSSSVQLSGSINMSDISNESCSSSTTESSNQTPGYLSANTPRKQKLAMEIQSGKKEIKNLKKTVVSLSQQLSNYDTVQNYLRLSEKYLSDSRIIYCC